MKTPYLQQQRSSRPNFKKVKITVMVQNCAQRSF